MPIYSGGGGGGSVTPPVTLAGTNVNTVPLTVVGAHNQNTTIFAAKSFGGTFGIDVEGDGADDIDAVGLTAASVIALVSSSDIRVNASREVKLQGARNNFVAFNAAPADGVLTAGAFALWLDSTNGAAKLMVKAKQADSTVVTAAIALS